MAHCTPKALYRETDCNLCHRWLIVHLRLNLYRSRETDCNLCHKWLIVQIIEVHKLMVLTTLKDQAWEEVEPIANEYCPHLSITHTIKTYVYASHVHILYQSEKRYMFRSVQCFCMLIATLVHYAFEWYPHGMEW